MTGRGSNPPGPRARRRDPRIATGRKPQAYIFDQGRKPASMPKKIAKGRKLSGARTAPYKAARPQAPPNP